jgi:hypothetical protein
LCNIFYLCAHKLVLGYKVNKYIKDKISIFKRYSFSIGLFAYQSTNCTSSVFYNKSHYWVIQFPSFFCEELWGSEILYYFQTDKLACLFDDKWHEAGESQAKALIAHSTAGSVSFMFTLVALELKSHVWHGRAETNPVRTHAWEIPSWLASLSVHHKGRHFLLS